MGQRFTGAYVERHDREDRFAKLKAVAEDKKLNKTLVVRQRLKPDLSAPVGLPFYSDSKFQRWLKRLKPRDELVARMALRHDIRDPGVSLKWEARIKTLERELVKTEDDWINLLRNVGRARENIALAKPPDKK